MPHTPRTPKHITVSLRNTKKVRRCNRNFSPWLRTTSQTTNSFSNWRRSTCRSARNGSPLSRSNKVKWFWVHPSIVSPTINPHNLLSQLKPPKNAAIIVAFCSQLWAPAVNNESDNQSNAKWDDSFSNRNKTATQLAILFSRKTTSYSKCGESRCTNFQTASSCWDANDIYSAIYMTFITSCCPTDIPE